VRVELRDSNSMKPHIKHTLGNGMEMTTRNMKPYMHSLAYTRLQILMCS